ADQRRRCQLVTELLGLACGMHQLLLACFSGLCVQPCNLLPAGMEITPYNHHREDSFLPSVFVLNTRLPGSNRVFALIQSILVVPPFGTTRVGFLTCFLSQIKNRKSKIPPPTLLTARQ